MELSHHQLPNMVERLFFCTQSIGKYNIDELLKSQVKNILLKFKSIFDSFLPEVTTVFSR